MKKNLVTKQQIIDYILSLLVMFIIMFYGYVYLVAAPFIGFDFRFPSGVINEVYVESDPPPGLQVTDRILEFNSINWEDYQDLRENDLFRGYAPGKVVPVIIERDGKILTLNWEYPGPNRLELLDRRRSGLFFLFPIMFWIAGVFTLFNLKAHDRRRYLLGFFFFLNAIWIVAGISSSWDMYYSSEVFHLAIWMLVPVSWQLHWELPKPKEHISPVFWWGFYITTAILALIDLLRFSPGNLYPLGLVLIITGSLFITITHVVRNPEKRRQFSVLLTILIVLAFAGVMSLITIFTGYSPAWMELLVLWCVSILPYGYFYAIYYHQVGGMEIRVGRAIGLIGYGVLVIIVLTLPLLILLISNRVFYIDMSVFILSSIALCVITAIIYPSYQRWVERSMLGMVLPPTELLTSYSDRIVTSLDIQNLSHLFTAEILPIMLIREAILIRIHGKLEGASGQDITLEPIMALNITPDQQPAVDEVITWITRKNNGRSSRYQNTSDEQTRLANWVRLVMEIRVENHLLGLCLFGRRDPDDYYSPAEISILQALVNQTGLALINIDQTRLLRALYQDDIERQEAERNRLAQALHDDVLGQLALLAQAASGDQNDSTFSEAYQGSVRRVREIIGGLRPPLLDYGLRPAFDGLVDEFDQPENGSSELTLELPASTERYPEEVELHLYRIAQQACRNALEHSQARQISVRGELMPGAVKLFIEDDGQGFQWRGPADLSSLLENKHYGLASMYERASLIGAELNLVSTPGRGTRISVSWQAPEAILD